MEFSLPWINEGRPFELRPVPFNGQREMQDLGYKFAEVEAARANMHSLWFISIIQAAKKVLDTKGVESAKAAWESTLASQQFLIDEFKWDDDEWETQFLGWHSSKFVDALGEGDEEKAAEVLKERMASATEEYKANEKDILDFNLNLSSLEFYWRLRASRVKMLTPEGDESVEIPWGDRDAAMALIGDYATKEDLVEIRKAANADTRSKPDKDFKVETPEAVRGKSSNPKNPTTESNASSQPSSTVDGSTEMTSETPATPSG